MGFRKRNKYSAIKINGYDSKKESRRAAELQLLQRAGEISDLQEQVRFELQPAFRTKQDVGIRKIEYIPDFIYFDNKLKAMVAEDVKGFKTDVYRIKAKLFQYKYPDYLFIES